MTLYLILYYQSHDLNTEATEVFHTFPVMLLSAVYIYTCGINNATSSKMYIKLFKLQIKTRLIALMSSVGNSNHFQPIAV